MEYGEYPQAREESVGQRRGMPHGLERLRRSSEEPPVDVVGVAAEIPKIVHQMLAMTRYAPPGASKRPDRYILETIYRERATNTT
jgi:hypothetical protein